MLVLTLRNNDSFKVEAPGCEPMMVIVMAATGKVKLGFAQNERSISITRTTAKEQEPTKKESE